MRHLVLAALAVLVAAIPLSAQKPDEAARLASNARRIAAEALVASEGYEALRELTDEIGPRLSGTAQAAQSVEWGAKQFRAMGLTPRLEPIMVPVWTRGIEGGHLTSHNNQKIVLTALGMSIATPDSGIEAEVVEAATLADVEKLGERAKGKIVFINHAFNQDLVRSGRAFLAYREVSGGRGSGAIAAAKLGAVGFIVRSLSSASMRNPHTGSLRYEEGVPSIPAAAVSTEDADLIHRLLSKGQTVRMKLLLTPRAGADVESANVVAEIRGSELPDEIVLVGGHLDSWDLGTGAIDNGSGVAMVLETMRILQKLKIRPRRTVRAVLFMNEENGLRGGRGYFEKYSSSVPRHVATLEVDAGVGEPVGFTTTLTGEALERFRAIVNPLLEPTGASQWLSQPRTGADTSFLNAAGVPGFGHFPDATKYFDHHHAASDTLDKVDPEELRKCSAAVSVLTYALADLEEPVQNEILKFAPPAAAN